MKIMPRAHRNFLDLNSTLDFSDCFHDMTPGYVWHITHHCHKQEFLLKFCKDRRRWLHWLFEAKKRYGLRVLNYVITSNHVHLLVLDTGGDVISKSMQLIAGRTAWEYNARKGRKGAYWEDRYHATAVDTDEHLFSCMVYIDMNMIRAGVVGHPEEWLHGGYREIQVSPQRYRIIDVTLLMKLCGVEDRRELQTQRRLWVENELVRGVQARDDMWTRSIAVGSKSFVERLNNTFALISRSGKIIEQDGKYILKDCPGRYNAVFGGKKCSLSLENTVKLDIFLLFINKLSWSDP